MTYPDHPYADLHDAPASGDTYQPGALTVQQMNQTDDDNHDRSPRAPSGLSENPR
jgi:hypothetical protein